MKEVAALGEQKHCQIMANSLFLKTFVVRNKQHTDSGFIFDQLCLI